MSIAFVEDIGPEKWNALCVASSDAWFRHTSMFITFALTLGEKSENRSFAVTSGGKLVGLVPLVVQKVAGSDAREFAMGGTPTPFPAIADELVLREKKMILTEIFTEIDRRAKRYGITRARFFVDPLSDPICDRTICTNPLLEYGFAGTSLETVSINLLLDEEAILAGFADRRRRYVLAAERRGDYMVDFFDSGNTTKGIFSEYEGLYFEAAGKRVGSDARWQETLRMLMCGEALLVVVRSRETREAIAGHLLFCYKNRAYDAISAIRPSFQGRQDIGSFMQWKTMQYLKARSFVRYEVGWIMPDASSEKEKAISRFKSLFGGDRLPVFTGEKRYVNPD
jgi:hypothetical protein